MITLYESIKNAMKSTILLLRDEVILLFEV